MLSYHHLPPFGALDHFPSIQVSAFGYPEAWIKSYRDSDFARVDPICKRALKTMKPLWWSDINDHHSDLNHDEIVFLKRADSYDLGEGLGVPVYGPKGRNGYVGLGFGHIKSKPSHRNLFSLTICCQLAHVQYCRILFDSLPKIPSLSKRETQVMEWISRGKSMSVIADIMNVSQATIDTYVRRIYAKMRTNDRVTTALRTVALGIVE